MNIVFMGTPEFAIPSLRMLHASHDVTAVYTRPDAASRRGRALVAPPVKMVADELGLQVLQPATLKDQEQIDVLRRLAPDAICVAAFGMILPKEILGIPRLGCINVHASLLPRYRGAAPIHRAVLAGDDVIGVSIMRMEEGLDTGPYAAQRSVSAAGLSIVQLTDLLAEQGAQALLGVLEDLERGDVVWVDQDEEHATYANKITRQDVALHPGLTTTQALRRIRVSTPQAPARLALGGTTLTVISASIAQSDIAPGGAVAQRGGLLIGFSDGALKLERVRPAGKGDMDGAAWLCGARLSEDRNWQEAL